LMPAILESGYNLDFFDDASFKEVGRVDGASFVLGPNKFKVVILPNVTRIPIDTYRKLEEFARAGGILIATRRTPAELPGFLASAENHNQIVELSKRLFEGSTARAHFVAEEKRQLGSTLNRLLRPDVALAPAVPDVGFVHRKTSDAEIYFLANTSNTPHQLKATFRVAGMNAEIWNPFTGNVESIDAEKGAPEGTTVSLELEPYGSRVLVFSRRALRGPQKANRTSAQLPLDISSGWQVTFGEDRRPVQMDKLRSWIDDDQTRYFSGVAIYEKQLMVPETLASGEVKLDFGEGRSIPSQSLRSGMQAWFEGPVREAAVVYVNDRRAGSVWCPPYEIDLTGLLRPGENKLRINVGNTAMNYMAGHSLPDYRLLNLRYGERFQAQDMDKVQPIPSGLTGPIRLVPR
jgi:alpha-L-rhamnosidase